MVVCESATGVLAMPTPHRRARGCNRRVAANGRPWGQNPATGDLDYSDAEFEWLRAIDRFRCLKGRRPTLEECFLIAMSLGYRKA